MNKQRVEHISQLFLNAGVILHRALGRAGGQYHFDERPGGPVHLVKHTPLYNWAKGDRYTYRDRGKTVRDITIDTLKDALLTQLPEQWAHVSIAVVEEPSVVHTANIPEGATHYRGTTRRLYYKKAADGGWLFYNHVVGNWQTSILFAVERGLVPLYNDDPTKAKSDSKWVSAFERGESFARSGLDVMSNPYTTEVARQEFFAGYAAYQRRTVNHG